MAAKAPPSGFRFETWLDAILVRIIPTETENNPAIASKTETIATPSGLWGAKGEGEDKFQCGKHLRVEYKMQSYTGCTFWRFPIPARNEGRRMNLITGIWFSFVSGGQFESFWGEIFSNPWSPVLIHTHKLKFGKLLALGLCIKRRVKYIKRS